MSAQDLESLLVQREYCFLAYIEAPLRPPRNPLSLASQGGRLDIISRLILATLYTNGVIAPETLLLVYINDKITKRSELVVLGDYCMPKSMLTEIEASKRLISVLYGEEACLTLEDVSLNYIVKRLRRVGFKPLVLIEDGEPIDIAHLTGKTLYILGTNVDPPQLQSVEKVCIASRSLIASNVVTLIKLLRILATIEPSIVMRVKSGLARRRAMSGARQLTS